MTDTAGNDGADTLEIDGPAGVKARARGPMASITLLIVTGFAGVITVVYLHHKDMKEDSTRLEAAVSEMVYIMSLSEGEREKLRISMPDSLRQKIRRTRDPD